MLYYIILWCSVLHYIILYHVILFYIIEGPRRRWAGRGSAGSRPGTRAPQGYGLCAPPGTSVMVLLLLVVIVVVVVAAVLVLVVVVVVAVVLLVLVLLVLPVPVKKTLLWKRGPLRRLAFGVPSQGLESSFCLWTAGQRLTQKECLFFRDTSKTRANVGP